LKRDPDASRLNNAVGLVHLRNGQFAEAEAHFAFAISRLTIRNPNPMMARHFITLDWPAGIRARVPKPMMPFTNEYGIMHGRAPDTLLSHQ
jgi:hypothetical protein